jgi:uncharacterized glyoxalase superfamily protein PhnB
MAELTPFLCVADGPAAIDWYVEVLGAEVTYEPIMMPDGRLGHVELAVDGAGWMMSGEFPDYDVQGPDPARGAAVSVHLAVDDVDALAQRMADAGASLDRPPADDELAGRVAVLRDPFGHRWFLSGPLRNG